MSMQCVLKSEKNGPGNITGESEVINKEITVIAADYCSFEFKS